MPLFHYEAVDASGQRSAGSVEAGDRGEALRKLSRNGLQPFSLRAKREPLMSDGGTKDREGRGGSTDVIKMSRAQVIQFTEELCDLLSAGLQLESALHAMENRSANIVRDLAFRLRDMVRDGVPFSIALQKVCPNFGELYCNLVAAGEAGGSLESILSRQARHLNQMEALRARMTTALIYPMFIIASGIALGMVFITYLLPKLATLLKSTSRDVPAVVTWLLSFSDFLKGWWWLLLLLLALLTVAVHVLFRDKTRLAWWDRVKLNLPLFGSLLRTSFEVQFLETMGNLLKNGLPLHRALELVRKATANLFLRERLGSVEMAVADGGSLSRALEKTGIARPLVVDMVRVGEQTGEMATTLEKAAERFDRQLSKVIERATALLQPAIMLAMAAMVGGMAWLMINIVFSTLQQVNHR